MKWTALLLLITLCACSGGTQEAEHAEAHPQWSYEGDTGPEHWAELDHSWEIAAKGKSQSPIDLGEAEPGDAGTLTFNYLESGFRITNNAHTVQVPVESGSWVEIDGKRYHHKQFHLHSPSEHAIDGEHSELEIHCVHEGENKELAVVGFLMDAGPASPNFDIFMDNIPTEGETRVIPDFRMNLSRMLPEDTDHKYHYSGSLTTPPCTENVEWIILKSHATASEAQIAKVRKYYQGNNRPIQPLNGRQVMVD